MFEGMWLLFAGLIMIGMLCSLFLALWLTVGMLKAFFYWASVVLGATVVMTGLLAWGTRTAAVPGSYQTTGVWGTSTLILRSDHTATQDVQFMEYDRPSVAPYKQHPTQHAVVQGRWEDRGRGTDWFSWFDRKLVISSLMELGPGNQGHIDSNFECSYGPVMLSGLGIEVDIGADIVYRK